MEDKAYNPNNVFHSKDFYHCAILRASGENLIAVERTGSGKEPATFIFSTNPDVARETIQKHWAGTLNLSSKLLIDAIVELKTRLYSGV